MLPGLFIDLLNLAKSQTPIINFFFSQGAETPTLKRIFMFGAPMCKSLGLWWCSGDESCVRKLLCKRAVKPHPPPCCQRPCRALALFVPRAVLTLLGGLNPESRNQCNTEDQHCFVSIDFVDLFMRTVRKTGALSLAGVFCGGNGECSGDDACMVWSPGGLVADVAMLNLKTVDYSTCRIRLLIFSRQDASAQLELLGICLWFGRRLVGSSAVVYHMSSSVVTTANFPPYLWLALVDRNPDQPPIECCPSAR
ncbi:hypothetical protein QBC45DRAFT_431550 [Copromyces sp. CBS 386.78]|nr:hypothetical protein QBC45DRAFT_431550 [Copromyces sp. CBS 386.78]